MSMNCRRLSDVHDGDHHAGDGGDGVRRQSVRDEGQAGTGLGAHGHTSLRRQSTSLLHPLRRRFSRRRRRLRGPVTAAAATSCPFGPAEPRRDHRPRRRRRRRRPVDAVRRAPDPLPSGRPPGRPVRQRRRRRRGLSAEVAVVVARGPAAGARLVGPRSSHGHAGRAAAAAWRRGAGGGPELLERLDKRRSRLRPTVLLVVSLSGRHHDRRALPTAHFTTIFHSGLRLGLCLVMRITSTEYFLDVSNCSALRLYFSRCRRGRMNLKSTPFNQRVITGEHVHST